MYQVKPGERVQFVQENAITFDDLKSPVGGDIAISGWMTTEKVNSYNQIVKADIFEHDEGMSRWNGRIMLGHGRQVLIGGGTDTPIGQIYNYESIKGEGIKANGIIYHQAPELLKRSVREGTMNAWSIGFMPLNWEEEEETDVVTFTKGTLHELTVTILGANDEALFEVTNSLAPNKQLQNREELMYIISEGTRYVVNSKGEVIDGF